jgi:hypothetical protein
VSAFHSSAEYHTGEAAGTSHQPVSLRIREYIILPAKYLQSVVIYYLNFYRVSVMELHI